MTFKRVFFVFLLVLFGVSAMMLYQVSQAVQHKEQQLAHKQYALQQLKEKKRMLDAEWAYLNRPDRLENVAKDVLDAKQQPVENVTGEVSLVPEPFVPSVSPAKRPDASGATDLTKKVNFDGVKKEGEGQE